jgi:hypothetical protein
MARANTVRTEYTNALVRFEGIVMLLFVVLKWFEAIAESRWRFALEPVTLEPVTFETVTFETVGNPHTVSLVC